MTPEPLMSISDVADYLQLKESTIYSWVQEGKIPAYRMGRLWRFRRVDLDKWLESYRYAPDEPEKDAKSQETPA